MTVAKSLQSSQRYSLSLSSSAELTTWLSLIYSIFPYVAMWSLELAFKSSRGLTFARNTMRTHSTLEFLSRVRIFTLFAILFAILEFREQAIADREDRNVDDTHEPDLVITSSATGLLLAWTRSNATRDLFFVASRKPGNIIQIISRATVGEPMCTCMCMFYAYMGVMQLRSLRS